MKKLLVVGGIMLLIFSACQNQKYLHPCEDAIVAVMVGRNIDKSICGGYYIFVTESLDTFRIKHNTVLGNFFTQGQDGDDTNEVYPTTVEMAVKDLDESDDCYNVLQQLECISLAGKSISLD